MKRILYILNRKTGALLCALGLLSAAGCQHPGAEPEPDVPAAPRPLAVNVNVDAATRSSVIDDQFRNGASINVLMLDPEGTATPRYGIQAVFTYNKPSDTEAGMWIAEQNKEFKVTNYTADVVAHYPAILPDDVLSTDMRSLTLPVKERIDIGSLKDYNSNNSLFMQLRENEPSVEVFMSAEEVDYMAGHAAEQVGGTVTTAKISMSHAQAMIVLHVYNAPENTNRVELQAFSLSNLAGKTPLQSVKTALSDNAWSPSGKAVAYSRTMSGFPIGSYFATLVCPAAIGENEAQLAITVGGAQYAFTLPTKEWMPGKIILYEVVVNSNTATLNPGVMVYDWDSDVIVHQLELS